MKTAKDYLVLILLFASSYLKSQVINDSIRVDWSYAGLQSTYVDTANIADVTTFGAIGNGITNDFNAVVNAMNSLGGQSGIVFFPPGNYLISSTLYIPDSVILKGAGADVTTLTFNFGGATGDCIKIQRGQSNTFINVTSGYTKNSIALEVSNASGFAPGDFVELRETNGIWDTNPAIWAVNAVGQLAQVDSITGNFLYINHPLRIDYDSALNVVIQKIVPRVNVGLECFRITRTDSTATNVNYGVFYSYAANCWMYGIESDHCIGAHVWAQASTALEITGCYFHHAYTYDGNSTNGYGVVMATHTGESKIENNIFRHLRHSMMVKQGANGNVFAYNYSVEPTRTEFPSNAGPDISLHGHYPFANLFEGNICQTLMIDQAWGPSGPMNTFFRNRIELYGIIMSSGSVNADRQNFVGNDVISTTPFQGNYLLTGTGHFTYGNNVQGTIQPNGTSMLPDSSYYLSSAPLCWNTTAAWPDIGTPNTTTGQTIPAKERYLSGNNFTLCQLPVLSHVEDVSQDHLSEANIFPSDFRDHITITINEKDAGNVWVKIYDIAGKIIEDKSINTIDGKNNVRISTNRLRSGFYLVEVSDKHFSKTFKCRKASY